MKARSFHSFDTFTGATAYCLCSDMASVPPYAMRRCLFLRHSFVLRY
jgi:hypothetical protein